MHGSAGAAGEWRRYWTVPLAGAFGYSCASLMSYGLGPFVAAIEADFGWSRAMTMSGITVTAIFAIFSSFLAGMAIDRFGPRRVGILGVVLMCASFSLLGTATGTGLNWTLLWLLIAVGMVFVQANAWTSAVASRFDAGRGFAIAVTLAGSSICAILAPLLAAWLMGDRGWRFGISALGLVWLALTLPVVLALFRGRREEELKARRGGTVPLPDADPGAGIAAVEPDDAPVLTGLTVRESMRLSAFWIIAFGNLAFVFYSMSIAPNLVPLLGTKGLDFDTAAATASLVGIVSLVARLSAGFLLDKFPAHLVATAIFLLPVLSGGLMLLDAPGPLVLGLAVAGFGATIGAEYDIVFYLVSRHMGLKHFGALLGAMLTAGAAGGIFAPVVAGGLYDATGNYDLVIMILMVVMAVAAAGMASLGRTARRAS